MEWDPLWGVGTQSGESERLLRAHNLLRGTTLAPQDLKGGGRNAARRRGTRLAKETTTHLAAHLSAPLVAMLEHLARAARVRRQICGAIVYLHHIGIAHRDIKPENVLCTDREPHVRGHVKLSDFGFAAEFDAASEGSFNQLLGTPEYLAPEMVQALASLPRAPGVRMT